MKALNPGGVREPFGLYSHGISVPAGHRLILTSGQLGVAPDDSVPETVAAQARLCFANISAILAEGDMGPRDVVRINAFVTERAHFPDYMAVRDAWLAEVPVKPASTLMIVGGFTRPEFLVEVEVTAASPD